jgi:hypothetical protein
VMAALTTNVVKPRPRTMAKPSIVIDTPAQGHWRAFRHPPRTSSNNAAHKVTIWPR